MQQPLVSICMPFYKGEDYIKESIATVAEQTYTNFELIVVDDASPNLPAQELLKDELSSLANLKIFRHEENKGLAATRNTCVSHARGSLYLPLDCDDKIAPDFLEATVPVLLNEGLDAIFTEVQIFGTYEMVWQAECDMIKIMSGLPVPSTILHKKEVFESINGYNPTIRRSIDSDFWVRALHKGCRVRRIDKPLYFYRKHATSISNEDQLTEVSDLATLNPELYKENLLAVLSCMEANHFKLKSQYQTLDEGFKKLESGYFDLLARYDEVVKRLQNRSVRHQLKRIFGSNKEA